MRSVFLLSPTWFRNSQRWECLGMSSELGSQSSRWSNGEWVWDCHFSGIGLVVCGKKRWFWEEERGKWSWEEDKASSLWNCHNAIYSEGIHNQLFTLFIYFYYFIERNSILFLIKWTNQISFYFLSNHYFNTPISLYLFNYKKLIIVFFKLYLF